MTPPTTTTTTTRPSLTLTWDTDICGCYFVDGDGRKVLPKGENEVYDRPFESVRDAVRQGYSVQYKRGVCLAF